MPVEVLEAVTVRHYTSRAGDPHRHLHLQINARVFAAGKWRGLHTVGVRDFLGAINGIGHAAVACDPELRAALRRARLHPGRDWRNTGARRLRGSVQRPGGADRGATWTATNASGPRRTPANTPARRCGGPGTPAHGPRAARTRSSPSPGRTSRTRWRAELAGLGYRDPSRPVALTPTPSARWTGTRAVERVLARLAAGRSAWNAADIRGEVERLIAADGIVADAAVRIELAEDLTARALGRCVPLLDRGGGAGARPVLDLPAGARGGGRPGHPVRRPGRPAGAGRRDLDRCRWG